MYTFKSPTIIENFEESVQESSDKASGMIKLHASYMDLSQESIVGLSLLSRVNTQFASAGSLLSRSTIIGIKCINSIECT